MNTEATHYCEHCGRKLNPAKIVWLEFDQRSGSYVDPDKTWVPMDWSLGIFPFGSDCAKRVLGQR